MKLTDRAIVNLKATGKIHKHFDGGGLYVHVSPTGGKLWRLFYRFNGKTKLVSFGSSPAVSLKAAREHRDRAKELLAQGIDPGEYKKEARQNEAALFENTFDAVAHEWFMKLQTRCTPGYAKIVKSRMERHLFPAIGKRPIAEIKPLELLTALRPVEAQGALETVHRLLQICGSVFRYAVATGKVERAITSDLRGALTPRKVRHHSTITEPRKVGALLRAIDSYQGQFTVACALKLAPLVFVRPSELRCAEWGEFNFDAAEWRIPAERMKMRVQHIVPLAKQTLDILNALRPVTGTGKYLFPSMRTQDRPISNNTINAALRRLGYDKDEMTGHGFRSMASTLLNEQGWNRDAIERQLAHGERNGVRAAYNFAEFLPERRKMMRAWANYLDKLRTQGS